ncbi:MAG: lytic transglycosylase [Verrucomicrobiaceae bacterium]|nr:lytic transglycosylase [Verrucomicrobiaceae bacterium]
MTLKARALKVKKRRNFSSLIASLNVVLCIFISACSQTQHTASISTPDRKAPRSGHGSSLSALPDIIDASDDIPNPKFDRLYSGDADTIWEPIRAGYKLDWDLDQPLIDDAVAWYRKNPTFVYRSTERSNRYMHYVLSAIQQRNMPTELALLPFIESAYDPFAYSRSGAAGLWQFVPQTASTFGLGHTWWYDGRKDIVASTDAALTYLQFLHDKFDGDWLLAVAAYNFGEGSIQRAVDENKRKGQPTDFWHLSLREETRTYVPRLLALAKIVNAPHKYGINLYAIPDKAYFAAVSTGGPLTLAKASDLSNVDVDELYRLNPGLNHSSIGPQDPQRLLIPIDSVDKFSRELALMPADKRGNLKQYDVAKGDTLAGIARKFNIDPAAIRNTNRLGDKLLRPGQSLLIPINGETETVAVAKTAPAPVAAQTPFGAIQIFHTVEAGDNLRRLSQRYDVSAKDIQRWNGLGADDPIKLGQKLNIWTDKQEVKAAQPKTVAVVSKKVGYTVQNGDSLTAIADKFKIEIEDILRWNQVNPRGLLQPGQRLTLYVSR